MKKRPTIHQPRAIGIPHVYTKVPLHGVIDEATLTAGETCRGCPLSSEEITNACDDCPLTAFLQAYVRKCKHEPVKRSTSGRKRKPVSATTTPLL